MERDVGDPSRLVKKLWLGLGLVAGGWFLGVAMQATGGVFPVSGDCEKHRCRCENRWLRVDADRGRLSAVEGEVLRLRRDLDRHLGGRGLGAPAAATAGE